SHVLDMVAALFGAPTVRSYADNGHAAGVETNCLIELQNRVARGVVQLSWNQPLVSGLRLVGSAAELVLDPGRLDAIRWRSRTGSWRTLRCDATWPADLALRGSRGTPRTHHDCIYYQLVSVLRAIVQGEPVPLPGENALATVRAIDACYRQATPLRLPWLSEAEQADADLRHWKAARCP